MKRTFVLLAIGLLVGSSLAMAAPTALSSTQLDGIVAGQGVLDWFLTDDEVDTTQVEGFQIDDNAVALAEDGATSNANSGAIANAAANGNATNGVDNTVANTMSQAIYADETAINAGTGTQAYAYDDSAANAGTGNVAAVVDIDGGGNRKAIAAGLNNVALVDSYIDADGATVIGNTNNTVSAGDNDDSAISFGTGTASVDNSEVEADGLTTSAVVVAREATVTESFNTTTSNTTILASINDSFNEIQNCFTVSGQTSASAIVLANSFDEQNIVANLIVTSAESTAPTGDTASAQAPVTVASTNAVQVAVNDTFIGIGLVDLSILGGLLPSGGVNY